MVIELNRRPGRRSQTAVIGGQEEQSALSLGRRQAIQEGALHHPRDATQFDVPGRVVGAVLVRDAIQGIPVRGQEQPLSRVLFHEAPESDPHVSSSDKTGRFFGPSAVHPGQERLAVGFTDQAIGVDALIRQALGQAGHGAKVL